MLAIVKKNTNNYIEVTPYYDDGILVNMDEHDYKKEIIKSNISRPIETEKKTSAFVNILIVNITNIKSKHPSFYEDYLSIVQDHIVSYLEDDGTINTSKAYIILDYVNQTKRRFKNEEIIFNINFFSATVIEQYLKIILNKRDYASYRKTKPVLIKAHFDRSAEYKIEYRNMLKEHFYKFVENY